jgi:D-psicose/D-tagatose/L-ribulose 3-epimerase
MPPSFRYSVCNEIFEKTPFADTCSAIHRLGYDGIEVAHFTLAERPAEITSRERAEYRSIMRDNNLAFVGLHWLMVAPAGLHVTTPDTEVRRRSWDHIRHLIDLCADLAGNATGAGKNGVMVFGSPKQRSSTGGMSRSEATQVFTEELARVAAQAESRGVRILVEPLPANQSDIINRLKEAVAIVDEIGSPAVRSMFDTHNAVDETEPHADLIRRYISYIEHVHVNEIDGREPGTSDYDFASLLAVLDELRFPGWVSLEAFDFKRGGEAIISGSLQHLKRCHDECRNKVQAGPSRN